MAVWERIRSYGLFEGSMSVGVGFEPGATCSILSIFPVCPWSCELSTAAPATCCLLPLLCHHGYPSGTENPKETLFSLSCLGQDVWSHQQKSNCQEIFKENNIINWDRDHSHNILPENVVILFPCPKNLPKAKLKNSGLISLEEISRRPLYLKNQCSFILSSIFILCLVWAISCKTFQSSEMARVKSNRVAT